MNAEAFFDLAKEWGMTVETTVYDCPVHFGWCMYKDGDENFVSHQAYCTVCDFRETRTAPFDRVRAFTEQINYEWQTQKVMLPKQENLIKPAFDIEARPCATSVTALATSTTKEKV